MKVSTISSHSPGREVALREILARVAGHVPQLFERPGQFTRHEDHGQKQESERHDLTGGVPGLELIEPTNGFEPREAEITSSKDCRDRCDTPASGPPPRRMDFTWATGRPSSRLRATSGMRSHAVRTVASRYPRVGTELHFPARALGLQGLPGERLRPLTCMRSSHSNSGAEQRLFRGLARRLQHQGRDALQQQRGQKQAEQDEPQPAFKRRDQAEPA